MDVLVELQCMDVLVELQCMDVLVQCMDVLVETSIYVACYSHRGIGTSEASARMCFYLAK